MASRLILTTFPAALLFLSPLSSGAPQSQDRHEASGAGTQSSVIRTTTRLVQVTVVVQDKNGLPITSLKEPDFSLRDNGQFQKIAFFSANTPTSVPARPLATHMFTNRADLKGQDPGAIVVILFDSLNTSSEDQTFARQQVLRFLRSLNHRTMSPFSR